MKRWTLVANESYGWWSRTSWRCAALNTSTGAADSTSARWTWALGMKAGNFSSSRLRSAMSWRPVRSSGPGSRKTSSSVTPSSLTSSSSTAGEIDSSTSSRTGGPKRRRSSSFSSAARRFSASSSSTSRSSLRVTRKVWASSTSMPGNRRRSCSPMTSSSGTNRWFPSETKRGKLGGTFTRAKCSLPLFGFRTRTARLSDRPEM